MLLNLNGRESTSYLMIRFLIRLTRTENQQMIIMHIWRPQADLVDLLAGLLADLPDGRDWECGDGPYISAVTAFFRIYRPPSPQIVDGMYIGNSTFLRIYHPLIAGSVDGKFARMPQPPESSVQRPRQNVDRKWYSEAPLHQILRYERSVLSAQCGTARKVGL